MESSVAGGANTALTRDSVRRNLFVVRLGLAARASLIFLAIVGVLLLAGLALARVSAGILPTHTPGARYYKVTQATIGKTVCVKG
jgi:hypothetical protein